MSRILAVYSRHAEFKSKLGLDQDEPYTSRIQQTCWVQVDFNYLLCSISLSRVQRKHMCNLRDKTRLIHAHAHGYIPTEIPSYLLHSYRPAFQRCPFWGSETGLKLVWNPIERERERQSQTCPFWGSETGMKLVWNHIRGFNCVQWEEESQPYRRLFVWHKLTFPSPSIVFGGTRDVNSIYWHHN